MAFALPAYNPPLSVADLQFGMGNSGLGLTTGGQMGLNPPSASGYGLGNTGLGQAASGVGGAGTGFNFGLNAPTLQMGLSGLNTLGNLWGAWQANSLARDQLDFTKSVTNTNLNNSIRSYNTALEDRARSRGFTEGRSDSEVQDYISANRLSR